MKTTSRQTAAVMALILGLGLAAASCRGKAKPKPARAAEARAMPFMQMVKKGMFRGEVETLIGRPTHLWEAAGYPLPFLNGIDEVWIYYNPFPDLHPRKGFLFLDILDRVAAVDREGSGLADPANPRIRSFVVYARDCQFCLQDAPYAEVFDAAAWEKALSTDKIAVAKGVVGIGTGTCGYVPVAVEFSVEKPADPDKNAWSLVQEAEIDIGSGYLLVSDSPEEEAGRVVLPSGPYRVRVHYGGLETATPEQPGKEYYYIIVWQEQGGAARP